MSQQGVNLLLTNIKYALSTDMTLKMFTFYQLDMSCDEKAFKREVSFWKLYWEN